MLKKWFDIIRLDWSIPIYVGCMVETTQNMMIITNDILEKFGHIDIESIDLDPDYPCIIVSCKHYLDIIMG